MTPVLEKPYISVSINPENIRFCHFTNGGHTRKSIMAAPMFLRIKRSILRGDGTGGWRWAYTTMSPHFFGKKNQIEAGFIYIIYNWSWKQNMCSKIRDIRLQMYAKTPNDLFCSSVLESLPPFSGPLPKLVLHFPVIFWPLPLTVRLNTNASSPLSCPAQKFVPTFRSSPTPLIRIKYECRDKLWCSIAIQKYWLHCHLC